MQQIQERFGGLAALQRGRAHLSAEIKGLVGTLAADRQRQRGPAHLSAGIELRRGAARLASEGRVAAAAANDAAATARLEAARAEFRLLAEAGSAQLADLFALARCEESLGDHERADALYTELMSRDLRRSKDGTVDYGPFGRAAATARGVLGWLRESGDWRPRRNVDDIALPSR